MKNRILLALAVVGTIVLLYLAFFYRSEKFGAIVPTQTSRYSLFASSTLSNAYTGATAVSTTGRLSKSLVNVALAGAYQANTTGAKAMILIERSIDDGLTYYPYHTITYETSGILMNTSGSSSSIGSPLIVPGIGASTSGTAVGFSSDFTIAADYLRFSAKEVSSSTGSVLTTPGILTLKALFTSL